MTALIQNLLVSVLVVVGLIVLMALHDVSAATGIPIIAGLAGVHVGANLSPSTSVTPVTRNNMNSPDA